MAREVEVTPEGQQELRRALDEARAQRDELTRMMADELDGATDLEDRQLEAEQHALTGVDARIDELEDALERAVVVPPPHDGRVALGSLVVLREEAGGQELRARLVSAVEATLSVGDETRLTDDSPVGRVLVGRRAGDTVEASVGGRALRYTVRAVEE